MTSMVENATSNIERAEEIKLLANDAFKGNCEYWFLLSYYGLGSGGLCLYFIYHQIYIIFLTISSASSKL